MARVLDCRQRGLLLKTILIDLIRSADGRRGWLRSLAYFVPVAAIVLYAHRDLYTGSTAPANTAHAVMSIDLALNATYCGKPDEVASRYSVQAFLSGRRDLMSAPFRNVIGAHAETVDNYCHYVNDFERLNENSVMWLARLALSRNVHLSPDGLGHFLGAIHIGMVLVFGFALILGGSSLVFSLAACMVAADVLHSVGVRESAYPFVTALPLLHAGLYGLALAGGLPRRRGPAFWIFALLMGALTSFSTSTRTMHLVLDTMMFALFLGAGLRRREGEARATWARAAAGAGAAFVVGYVMHYAIFTAPFSSSKRPAVGNYVYHTFAHPLVLGLAVPENDFSRREKIEWNDELGLTLARRAVPDATYLGPKYEGALLKYWGSLWRAHPGDMANTYWIKLRSTGSGVFQSVAALGGNYYLPPAIGEWLDTATNGIFLFAVAFAIFVTSLWTAWKGGPAWRMVTALVSLATLASLGEGFLTYSTFVGIYFSILLFFVFFAALVAIQAAIDAVAGRLGRGAVAR